MLKKEILDAAVNYNYMKQDAQFDEFNSTYLMEFFKALKSVDPQNK
jgi:hypothetical protein